MAGAGDLNGNGYDDLVIGAYLFDHFFQDEGASFVYLGSPAGLSAEPDWAATGDQEAAHLAGDVNGDGLQAGLWRYDHPALAAISIDTRGRDGYNSGVADRSAPTEP